MGFLVKNWHVYLKIHPLSRIRHEEQTLVCRLYFPKKKGSFLACLHRFTLLLCLHPLVPAINDSTHFLITNLSHSMWCWMLMPTDRPNIFVNTNEIVPMRVLIFVYGWIFLILQLPNSTASTLLHSYTRYTYVKSTSTC